MVPEAPSLGGEGGRAPPHLLSPIMGTLMTQGPKGPKMPLRALAIEPYRALQSLMNLSGTLYSLTTFHLAPGVGDNMAACRWHCLQIGVRSGGAKHNKKETM